MKLIDTHSHLTFEELENQIDAVLARSVKAGVTRWITVGTDTEQNEKVLSLVGRYDRMWAGLGYHPHCANDITDADMELLKKQAQDAKVVAVGECGLDYHYMNSVAESQQRVFRQHLDIAAQTMLFTTLKAFHGVGILVSHDRKFLDELCHQCLFVESPNAILRPGNYTQGLQLTEKEEMYAVKQRQQARHELSRIKREASRRRDAASQADRKRSKRRISHKDHDAKGKIDQARVTGKDGIAGKRLNQLSGRLSQAQVKLQKVKVKKHYAMGIWVSGEKSKRNTLFSLPAGSLCLGGDRWLHLPDLLMKPDDRVALTGPNGSGKTTLIGHIIHTLNIGKDRIIYLSQEIDIHDSQDIMAKARMLPNEKLGRMMTVVSRLGSRPHRLLDSVEPSPGEIRKILLATGIANMPYLIVMDEPTNHLDLPSIECLEHALTDCPCGLLLVSHDQRFLDALARKRWQLSEDIRIKGNYILEIQYS